MNLGSILGLEGRSTWTNPDILGNSCQKAAPSSPFVLWGTPRTVNERSDARSGLLARIT